jgi:hypothetical protein
MLLAWLNQSGRSEAEEDFVCHQQVGGSDGASVYGFLGGRRRARPYPNPVRVSRGF